MICNNCFKYTIHNLFYKTPIKLLNFFKIKTINLTKIAFNMAWIQSLDSQKLIFAILIYYLI